MAKKDRSLKDQDLMGKSIRPKLPFRDARGQIWIYRDDDTRRTPVAMGPFFTAEYAVECKEHAAQDGAPMGLVLAHDQPVPPFTPITPRPYPKPSTTISRRSRDQIEYY